MYKSRFCVDTRKISFAIMSSEISVSRAIILKQKAKLPSNRVRPATLNEISGVISIQYVSNLLFRKTVKSLALQEADVSAPRRASSKETSLVIQSKRVRGRFPEEKLTAIFCIDVRIDHHSLTLFAVPDACLVPLYTKLTKVSVSEIPLSPANLVAISAFTLPSRRVSSPVNAASPLQLEMVQSTKLFADLVPPTRLVYATQPEGVLTAMVISAVFGGLFATTETANVLAGYLLFLGSFVWATNVRHA